MIKLRKLDIVGFRGVRFALPIDFKKEARSLSIYGENGSGKSSVTDALEWFIKGKVDHLWREDCNEDSLRHVLLDPTDISSVAVEFTGSIKNTKELNAKLNATDQDKSKPYKETISALRKENIFLRHADITEFIQYTKNQKRTAIASIIGYDSISDFRSTIQSSLNALQKDEQFVTSRKIIEDQKRIFLELAGQFISTPQELFAQIEKDLNAAGFDMKVANADSYDNALKGLRGKIHQEERLEKRLLLDAFVKEIMLLQTAIDSIDGMFDFVLQYNELVSEKENVRQIHFQQFLASGIKIIDGGYADDSKCPFCWSAYDLTKLKAEVDTRIQAISHITEQLSIAGTSASALTSALSQVVVVSERICARFMSIETPNSLCKNVQEMAKEISSLSANFRSRFSLNHKLDVPSEVLERLKKLRLTADVDHAAVLKTIEGLHFTEYEKKIVGLIERLRELREAYSRYDEHAKISSAFQEQILSLGSIFDEFLKVQNSALQTVLDGISSDVGAFYKALHPEENVDSVRLKITGEEGIEFEYSFHGAPTHPPTKYLSESHLNSLGVVLFLASARLFNQSSRFLILDDIVTSFDFNHRRRLLRLLKDEFSDWQILLLTHDSFWFEMIRKEMAPAGWMAFEVVNENENGTLIEPSSTDLATLIQQKRLKFDVSNDLRRLMESSLKEICYAIGAKFAFRYNDQNEKRMSGELLSELRSTINRKAPSLKGHSIFANLAGSNLVVSTGSHDNPEPISGGDIDVALEDISTLRSLFCCSKCNGFVDAQNSVPGQDAIACRCGQTVLEWKQ